MDLSLDLSARQLASLGNEDALRVLYNLNAQGFRCGLDDFGAGYCSFSLMRQLPLSSLKIDPSFIEEIEESAQFRELVGALIAFSKRLGLRTVAEGVSSQQQLAFLRDNGCDAVQGFLFGEPLAAEELPDYFREQPWWP